MSKNFDSLVVEAIATGTNLEKFDKVAKFSGDDMTGYFEACEKALKNLDKLPESYAKWLFSRANVTSANDGMALAFDCKDHQTMIQVVMAWQQSPAGIAALMGGLDLNQLGQAREVLGQATDKAGKALYSAEIDLYKNITELVQSFLDQFGKEKFTLRKDVSKDQVTFSKSIDVKVPEVGPCKFRLNAILQPIFSDK